MRRQTKQRRAARDVKACLRQKRVEARRDRVLEWHALTFHERVADEHHTRPHVSADEF